MMRISIVSPFFLLSCAVPKAEAGGDGPGDSGGAVQGSSDADDSEGAAGGSAAVHETVWVGDILLADAAQDHLEEHGHGWPFVHVEALVVADALIGNAEGPITALADKYNEDQTWSYNADPAAAEALAELGFTAMSLGNNHLLDRGPEGVADTVRHLDDAGVATFGGGVTSVAVEPFLMSTDAGVVAIVGFGDVFGYSPPATDDVPGVIPYDEATARDGYERALAGGADWVVAYVHWGSNYAPVLDEQREGAQWFADAGYDLVVGHGPHVAQTFDIVEGMPVLYSLGNFTFGTPGRWSEEFPGYGLVLRTFIGSSGLEAIELSCIVTDNDRVTFQPVPCVGDEARRVLSDVSPLLEVDGNVARWRP